MNARENPFATHHLHRVPYVFDQLNWDSLLRRLEALQYRAAIVGPHGSGKTTLLEQLGDRLESRGFDVHWHKRHDTGPRLRPDDLEPLRGLRQTDALLLDSAELLSAWQWRRFRRAAANAGAMVITAHRFGRLPTLLECCTSPGLLHHVVHAVAPGSLSPAGSRQLFAKHGGNIRDALRDLYDQHASR